MSQYYGESQWLGAGSGQPTWDHQTPPPARSGELSHDDNRSRKRTPIDPSNTGASSAIPREESAAFLQQIEGTSDEIQPRRKREGRTRDGVRE